MLFHHLVKLTIPLFKSIVLTCSLENNPKRKTIQLLTGAEIVAAISG